MNDEEYDPLVLHTELRWLSKGECINRFVQPFDTILEFMTEHNLLFHNQILESKPAIFYLSDVFEKLKAVNKQLQGNNANLITCKEAVTALIKKLDLLCFYMKR